MLNALMNCFKIPDLRKKLMFTIGMLVVYHIGYWVPVPGIDQQILKDFFEQETSEGSAFGRVAQFVSIFSGDRFLPPAVMMISFLRPVIRRKPSSSMEPTSPVW